MNENGSGAVVVPVRNAGELALPDRPEPASANSGYASPATVRSVRLAVATARNRRQRNEDAIGVGGWVLHGEDVQPLSFTVPVVTGRPAIVAVADGLGGLPDGDRAARLAAERLTRCRTARTSTDLMRAAFIEADTEIRAATPEGSPGMACTAAALQVRADGIATVANLGDVRVYLILDGYLGQLTEDHRPHTIGSAVSRCLGGVRRPDPTPYVHRFRVRGGDRLIICSDGVYDAITYEDLVAGARRQHGSSAAVELLNAALGTDHGDNVTVAIVDVTGDPRD